MARLRVLGDRVLRVAEGLKVRVPGVVTATTGVDSLGAPSSTGATVNVYDPRSPADKARPGTIQNTDGATAGTWNFTALSGLKLDTAATVAAGIAGTVDKPAGKVILQSGSAAYTLTNSWISTTSIVLVRVMTSGDTVNLLSVVPGDGSCVITLSGTVGADTTLGFLVVN